MTATLPVPAVAPLFEPIKLSDDLTLPNRIVMAPLTRCMAGPGLVPTEASATYYARRADAGLIISEATIIRPDGQGYPDTPGIWSEEQVAGWTRVTKAVHAAGGRMFLQLWHVGRVSHSTYHGGRPPVAPSAIAMKGRVSRIQPATEYETPRALEAHEIEQIIRDYATGARNAMRAGFDGVEIHAANTYLIEQFLRAGSNVRTDRWGGDAQARTTFAFEVIDSVLSEVPASRVGIRLSPAAQGTMPASPDDPEAYRILLDGIAARGLAYVHSSIGDDGPVYPDLGERVSEWTRRHYHGNLVIVGNYTPETAADAVANNRAQMVALGRPFIANGDLVKRVRGGEAMRPYDPAMLTTLE